MVPIIEFRPRLSMPGKEPGCISTAGLRISIVTVATARMIQSVCM